MMSEPSTDNTRAIALMVVSMACFALEDSFIKLASASIGIGQILLVLGIIGGTFYAVMGKRNGLTLFSRDHLDPMLLFRTTSEVVGTFGFVTALTRIDLSVASAILQATPLAVTLGAALFLREAVGWRRWLAIAIGFTGVLFIIRPGLGAFDPDSLYAVLGVIGLAARDVVTRRVPKSIPTSVIALQAFVAIGLLGIAMMPVTKGWQTMTGETIGLMAAAGLCGIIGYFAITTSLRLGEVSAVSPFRYTRLVFALVIGYLIFGEVPDAAMLVGATLIVGSGLYALYRERLRKRALRSIPQPGL